MTDQETPRQHTPATVDPWSIWFFRIVQVVGLLIVIYEVRWEHNDRPWLLLIAGAMMLGGVGLQLIARGLVKRFGAES